jgi:hypothetical protein
VYKQGILQCSIKNHFKAFLNGFSGLKRFRKLWGKNDKALLGFLKRPKISSVKNYFPFDKRGSKSVQFSILRV